MPLQLLAKDSIQDLEALGRETESETTEKDTINNHRHDNNAEGATTTTLSLDKTNTAKTPIQERPSSEPTTLTASNETKSQSFTTYHDQYFNDEHDYYGTATSTSSGMEIQTKPSIGLLQSILPCLFPWTMASNTTKLENFPVHNDSNTKAGQPARDPSSSDDEETSSTKDEDQPLVRESPLQSDPLEIPSQVSKSMRVKGILKRGSMIVPPKQLDLNEQNKGRNNNRRMLFPQVSYDTTMNDDNQKSNQNHVVFSPMARVVTVKSKNDMTIVEKSGIWWQRADYEDFRKTARVITKAMMEGGSDLWLNSERATGRKSGAGKWNEAGDLITETGDKWWHKFGHSRRGLEHVVSMEEGRERQVNVRSAIRAVVEEQKRQKLYNRSDPDKLRMVSLHYTSWARDLALASGSSDADAVSCSFSEQRRSREFFLLKMSRDKSGGVKTVANQHVPEFMQPAFNGGVQRPLSKATTTAVMLDANTSAQIRYRRKSQSQKQQQQQQQQKNTRPLSDPVEAPISVAVVDHSIGSNKAIADKGSGGIEKKSMAQIAAGFSAAEGAEKVDMAAVLSGMGAMPKSSKVVPAAH